MRTFVITAGDKTATLSKPLAPKGRTAVKLPKLKGCTVSVAATFDGGSKSGADAFDGCIATRYEKTARSFLSVLHLAAACDWLKP